MSNLISLLATDEFKKQLVQALNENIDIPIINEKLEAKILEAILETILVIATKLSNRMI